MQYGKKGVYVLYVVVSIVSIDKYAGIDSDHFIILAQSISTHTTIHANTFMQGKTSAD